ncbi:MAG: aminomethyl-transferring glycine dehydrogenase subunit GcvPB, partial [Bacteroidales bacterium]|nr:aminomethyl-transferring glycine dehydrogenase subunit GcvPB [Bacteroidales bacterium]
NSNTILLSLGESIDNVTIHTILKIFANATGKEIGEINIPKEKIYFNIKFQRKTGFLSYPVFNLYHSETDMMRYIKKLEKKDYSLTEGMIPLGSCTMKLNAVSGMMPVSWPEFANIHPFAPENQVEGYKILIKELEEDLKKITGFEAISFMPNSGAAGEYAGLMVIREYFKNRRELHRNIVLIPSSAHGTNPASAVMAGMELIVIKCDENGNIDIHDLKSKAENNKDNLCAFMVTYPSTHGVFEDKIIEMIKIVHENGGQVYMDGANLNAQVGLTNPAIIGADVCHLNLHKTFGIPHGGGGPGVGPIGVAKHLVEFLPTHPIVTTEGKKGIKAVSAAPYGSANILPISHAYIKLLGTEGLKKATKIAILNANYIAVCLKKHYKILYTGKNGYIAHEFILDCREFKNSANIAELDIAKRLMDYGFHAPTVSFPVHGTLMIEPTESEPKQELDRFIKAMISIYEEIKEIESGKFSKDDNVLINSPYTAEIIVNDNWEHPYSREKAAFPSEYNLENKYWPTVSRLQDAYGDRNLICTCIPIERLVSL